MKKTTSGESSKATVQVNKYIAGFDDWRGTTLATLRKAILAASPDLLEEWKWGSPVWTYHGLVCAASGFKDHVKVNFFKGASLKDPHRIFNAGLDAKTMRSIDYRQGDKVDSAPLKAMVKAAIAFNQSSPKK